MAKTTTDTESCDGDTVTINCYDVFTQGDCYAVTFDREERMFLSNGHGVQAIDGETGEPIAHDLTPEQHGRLGDLAAPKALDAIERWNWDCEMDAAS